MIAYHKQKCLESHFFTELSNKTKELQRNFGILRHYLFGMWRNVVYNCLKEQKSTELEVTICRHARRRDFSGILQKPVKLRNM